MGKDILEEFIPDLEEFKEKTMAFHKQNIRDFLVALEVMRSVAVKSIC